LIRAVRLYMGALTRLDLGYLLIFINNYRGLCRELWNSLFGKKYNAPFGAVL